jgi:site-specific DNA-methyltransferase (adenine-specific)
MMPELNTIYLGDNLATMRAWPDAFVHTCVTSPPYYALRDYGVAGQIGLESTPEAFIAKLVEVFREVRRVLRDDGTLWVNMGDSYNAYNGNRGTASEFAGKRNEMEPAFPKGHGLAAKGLKPKDLIGIPWMLAFALRADGWYLRSEIIWAKKNCMPESVTDRPTKAHEHIFLLSKRPEYFYDAEAIKEPVAESSIARVSQNDGKPNWNTERERSGGAQSEQTMDITKMVSADGMRNKRDVWHVATQPFKEAHFATFPPDLIAPCIQAGTSERGVCDACGAPIERVTEKGALAGEAKIQDTDRPAAGVRGVSKTSALRTNGRTWRETVQKGWRPTCKCHGGGYSKAIVLDPFMGAGTTALVAAQNGRAFLGCELNPAYKEIADKRIANEVAQEKFL